MWLAKASVRVYMHGCCVVCNHQKKRKAIKRLLRGTTRASSQLRVAAFACVCSGPGVCMSAGAISSATASSYTSRRVAHIRPVELQHDRVFDPWEIPTMNG